MAARLSSESNNSSGSHLASEDIQELKNACFNMAKAKRPGWMTVKEFADEIFRDTLFRLTKKIQANEYDPEQGTIVQYGVGIAKFIRKEVLDREYKLRDREDSMSVLENRETGDAPDWSIEDVAWSINDLNTDPQECVEKDNLLSVCREILSKKNPRLALAFDLYLLGLSGKEAAIKMKVNPPAYRKMVSRAKEELIKQLGLI